MSDSDKAVGRVTSSLIAIKTGDEITTPNETYLLGNFVLGTDQVERRIQH